MNNPNIGDVDQENDNCLIITYKSLQFEEPESGIYFTTYDSNRQKLCLAGASRRPGGLGYWPKTPVQPRFLSALCCLTKAKKKKKILKDIETDFKKIKLIFGLLDWNLNEFMDVIFLKKIFTIDVKEDVEGKILSQHFACTSGDSVKAPQH